MAGKVQGVTPQSRIHPFLCKDAALMGHKELQLPLCAEENIQENEKVGRSWRVWGFGRWGWGLPASNSLWDHPSFPASPLCVPAQEPAQSRAEEMIRLCGRRNEMLKSDWFVFAALCGVTNTTPA